MSNVYTTLNLDLGEYSYPIHIGPGLLGDADLLKGKLRSTRALIVTNAAVAEHYLDQALASLAGIQVDVHLMPDGEQFKTLKTLEGIIGTLLEKGHTRSTTLFALGGGVVGDTTGFAAASYQRGVDFVQLPTTLLSQVDSSVGGKTAVNHALGKNMIGAFYQPRQVVIDTESLRTLPPRELSAGLAEVIKHGALADRGYFDQIEAEISELMDIAPEAMIRAISGSCRIKSNIVAQDEKESGVRALLNFGHTFGHAIEAAVGYGEWLHGEAVGTGMVMAADLSMRLGRCSAEDAMRLKQLVSAAGLPLVPPQVPAEDFVALMARDKKATDSGLRFVLLDGGLGKTELVSGVSEAVVAETLAAGEALCEGA